MFISFKVAQKLIIKECVIRTTIVLLSVISLFIVFDILDSSLLTIIKKGGLRLFFTELFFGIPRLTYELLPLAVLMGVIWALSQLGRHNELTILRVSGYRIKYLMYLLALFGAVVGIFGVFFDEVLDNYSKKFTNALFIDNENNLVDKKALNNIWIRYKEKLIRVNQLNGDNAAHITIVHLSPKFNQVESVIYAEKGKYISDNEQRYWELTNVVSHRFIMDITKENESNLDSWLDNSMSWLQQKDNGGVQVSNFTKFIWKDSPEPRYFIQQENKTENLKLFDLLPLYTYNLENKLRFEPIAVAMWKKILYPPMLAIMAIIGIPFCLKTGRQVQTNLRLLIAILIGIVFFVIHGIFTQLGTIALPPFISVITPLLMFLLFTIVGVWLVQIR